MMDKELIMGCHLIGPIAPGDLQIAKPESAGLPAHTDARG
jgi:hypothetical protein